MILTKVLVAAMLASPLVFSTVLPRANSGLVSPYQLGVCGYCNYCAIPVEYSHEFGESGIGNRLHGWYYHECWIGPCDHHDGGCNAAAYGAASPENAQLAIEVTGAVVAVQRNDLGPLDDLMRRYPERVTLNLRRSAVQITGCSRDLIAAHVPLTASQVARLLL